MNVPKLLLISCAAIGAFFTSVSAQWVKQNVDTTAGLRGLAVVNEKIIWASGTGGTVIRTVDGGVNWKVIKVPDAAKLDFRDIEAFDANTAYILSIGNGESSRIYKTIDGGKIWKLQFTNTDEKAFFDAIACWDRNNCIAMSDPVDNRFVLINTTDGGSNWKPMDTSKMPPTKDGEAAFAASGTCVITQGKNNAFLVTGGNNARVFRSNDRGKTWLVADTPMIKGTAGSGIFSIAMRNAVNGVIVGGNYEKPKEGAKTVAYTNNGGRTRKLGADLFGYRSAIAYLSPKMMIAVGPSGANYTASGGRHWQMLDPGEYNAIAVARHGRSASVWVVGAKGLVVSLNIYDVNKDEFGSL